MAYVLMADIIMANVVMAEIAMACVGTAYVLMAYVLMAYVLMAYVVMAYIVMANVVMALCSYGLCSCGPYSYGLHSCGLCSYGLYSYGLHSYGLYSYPTQDGACLTTAAVVEPFGHCLYRLYLGITDGMFIARVWACRYSKCSPLRGGYFENRHAHNARNGHAVSDAEGRIVAFSTARALLSNAAAVERFGRCPYTATARAVPRLPCPRPCRSTELLGAVAYRRKNKI